MFKLIKLSPLIVVALAASAFFAPAQAGKLSSVADSPKTVQINMPYELTFVFEGDPAAVACGLKVDWGDGQVEKFRVGENQQLRPPFKVQHVYTVLGPKKIDIQGEVMIRGLKSLAACDARFSGIKNVIDPVQEARKSAASDEAKAQRERTKAEAAKAAAERARAETELYRIEAERLRAVADAEKAAADKARAAAGRAAAARTQQEADKNRASTPSAAPPQPAETAPRPAAPASGPTPDAPAPKPKPKPKVGTALDI